MAVLSPLVDPCLDDPEPRPEALDQLDSLVLRVGHRADGRDRVEDALDRRRFERHDRDVGIDRARDIVHLAVADRANLAQLLGQDQVRMRVLEGGFIERVERGAAVDRVAHEPVDVAAARQREVEHAARHHRRTGDLRRPIAFMRDANELVAQAEGSNDLGGRG